MLLSLVKIGNSRGIRIPKTVIDQCHFENDVECEVQSGTLILKPSRVPRQGWNEAFLTMSHSGDDALIDQNRPTEWDRSEWVW